MRMKWAGHIVRMEEMKNAYKVLVRDHTKDLGVDGRIILKWILQKQNVRLSTEFNWFRVRIQWRRLVKMMMKFWAP
jgi:hypothetical protein